MRKRWLLGVAILIAGSIIAFAENAGETGAGKPIAELKVGTSYDATKPGDYSAQGMWEPGVLIYECLVSLDQKSMPVPCLADSWDISPDGLRYVFHLHPGVRFHDGSAFDAPALASNFRSFQGSTWAKLVPYLKEVAVVNAQTAEFRMKKPHPLLLQELSNARYGVIAPSAIEAPKQDKASASQKPEGMGGKSGMGTASGSMPMGGASAPAPVVARPIGTGPYRWDESAYARNRSFSVTANPDYWRGEPRIKRITWEVIPDAGARSMALESGRIQMTGQSTNASIGADNLASLKKNKDLRIVMAGNWGTRLVIINHTRPPFDQTQARRALRLAIDTSEIQEVIGDMATICPGPFGPGTPLQDPGIALAAYDPAQARKIFDGLGIVDKDGDGIREYSGHKLSLEVISSKDPKLAILLQEQLKKVGIEIRIASKEQASSFEILDQMAFDIAVHNNIPSFSLDLYEQFSEKGQWTMHLNDPALEALLGEFRTCTTYERLVSLSREIEKRIDEKQIVLFAINERKTAVYRKDLGEFVFPPEEWVGALQEIWRM
jgi:nickel transport system substrate-binding protein